MTQHFLEQMTLFDDPTECRKTDTTSTFTGNLSLPIHRWYRYSAGFSAQWAREVIEREKAEGRKFILDPFAGSGTVLLEAESAGVTGYGIEAHPFVARIARIKLLWRVNTSDFRSSALRILEDANKSKDPLPDYPKLIMKCYPDSILLQLHRLSRAWKRFADGTPVSELAWLALVTILRECSPAGTAPWQYVLPKKRKAKTIEPFQAYFKKVHLMKHDMMNRQRASIKINAKLFEEDAKSCDSIKDSSIDLIITSPPYANNYDYADATRLEMTFLGDIRSWGDLQHAARKHLVRSCTQHVSALRRPFSDLLEDKCLLPIQREIGDIARKLEREKQDHGGKKNYDLMVLGYFADMARVWQALRRVAADGSLVCFVVGDSAPYGIHVPVDRWLGELALASGFRSYAFEKTRDRNVKWRNRKHRVPLHEGRLWVKG